MICHAGRSGSVRPGHESLAGGSGRHGTTSGSSRCLVVRISGRRCSSAGSSCRQPDGGTHGNVHRSFCTNPENVCSGRSSSGAGNRNRLPVLPVLHCPSFWGTTRTYSNYSGCHNSTEIPVSADADGLLYLNSSESLESVPDGVSCTVVVGEVAQLPIESRWFLGDRTTLRNADAAKVSTSPTPPLRQVFLRPPQQKRKP
ncbi:MAG: DUF1559 domain-containing protein [Planctomycetaceae bacterium]